MRPKHTILIAVVLVFFSCSSPALAAKHHKKHHHVTIKVHIPTNPETLALGLAEKYWGIPPCGGRVSIRVGDTPPIEATGDKEGLETGVNAGATVAAFTEWQTPAGPNDLQANPMSYFDCTITMSVTDWPNWRADDFEFQEYCDIMTHEVGHLFGHGDAEETNPSSITYPFLNLDNFNSVSECRGITLYYGHEEFRDESEAEVMCEQKRAEEASKDHRESWESC